MRSSTCCFRSSNSFLRLILKRKALSLFCCNLYKAKHTVNICLTTAHTPYAIYLIYLDTYLLSFFVDLDWLLFFLPRLDLAGAAGTSIYWSSVAMKEHSDMEVVLLFTVCILNKHEKSVRRGLLNERYWCFKYLLFHSL